MLLWVVRSNIVEVRKLHPWLVQELAPFLRTECPITIPYKTGHNCQVHHTNFVAHLGLSWNGCCVYQLHNEWPAASDGSLGRITKYTMRLVSIVSD